MVAQALLEKGVLESASQGVWNLITEVRSVASANPYLVLGVIAVVLLLLMKRRG